MNESKVQVQITEDLIKPIIEAKVQAAVIEAIGSEKELVTKFISTALETRVAANGKVSSYDRENKYTVLEQMCLDNIRKAAKDAIKEWLESNQSQIKEALLKQLSTKKMAGEFTKACLTGLLESMQSTWKFQLKVGLKGFEND